MAHNVRRYDEGVEIMFKNKRGSITFVAYLAMMFFAMYGIILFRNSISAYNNQNKAIKNVQDSYSINTSEQAMKSLYNKYKN